MRIAILFLACLLAPASPILGQTFGEITGEIRDSSGGAIANAAVTVTNLATGGARTSGSNPVGVYTFPSLPPGIYDLKVTAAGFQVVTRRDIELQVQQTARIDFSLQVGEVTQTVEITGGSRYSRRKTQPSAPSSKTGGLSISPSTAGTPWLWFFSVPMSPSGSAPATWD